jgi:hypothetical protein
VRAGFAVLNIAFNWRRPIISHSLCGSHEAFGQRRPTITVNGMFRRFAGAGWTCGDQPGGPFSSGDRHGVATDVGFFGVEPRGPTHAST